MKPFKNILIILSLTVGIHAGAPGPFSIDMYDAGVPPWLNQNTILNGLKSKKVFVGITTSYIENVRKIIRVLSPSSAEEAGLKVGDIIKNKNWSSMLDNKLPNDIVEYVILRDKKEMHIKVKLGFKDPLIDALEDIENTDTFSGESGHKEFHYLSQKNRNIMYKNAFLDNKIFDCKNAHKKFSLKMLPTSEFIGYGAQVIVIRGSHRVMFINKSNKTKVGANTVCVNSADYDGKNLTVKKVTKLYKRLFDEQISDGYENP